MKSHVKKILMPAIALLLLGSTVGMSAFAGGWSRSWGSSGGSSWSSYSSWGGYHHHHHNHGGRFATGLAVGGLVGVLAGSAMANANQPRYQNNYYYEQPQQDCYRERAWSRRFCDDNGCFVRTAWRTVCN